MAVIIRLQNLPWSANAMDIRQFFHGLNIPDGGVHIVGGEKGDAFIAFSTDEDARQAINRTGERLNNVAVKLLLSSKTEMQSVIAQARGVPLSAVPGMSGFANNAPPSAEAFGTGFDIPPNDFPDAGDFASQAYYNNSMAGPTDTWDTPMAFMDPMQGNFGGNFPMGGNMDGSQFNGGRKRLFSDMTDCCCFVTNMSPSINYKDVRRLFVGLEIPRDGLKLINDENGERVGEAFVRFATPEIANQAANQQWEMDKQPVFVERCPVDVFENAIDSFVPGKTRPLAMGGDMPPDTKRRRAGSPNPCKHNTTCAAIKNLPYNVQRRDLFHFFSGMKFARGDASVHIENRTDGLPSGIALIEFATELDFKKASVLFGEPLMGRPVEVHPIPQEEYENRVAKSEKLQPPVPRSERRPKREENNSKEGEEKREHNNETEEGESRKRESRDDERQPKYFYCIQMFGLPFSCTYRMVEEFFEGLSIAKKGVHLIVMANGKTGPLGFVEFTTSADCDKALERHKEYMGTRYIEIKQVTKRQMMDEVGKLKQIELEKRGPPPPPRSASYDSKPQSRVVRIANLHANATLEDIGHFFRGFDPIMSSVKIRYINGIPTGDAMLEFGSSRDALGAVRRLDGSMLIGRPVSVFMA